MIDTKKIRDQAQCSRNNAEIGNGWASSIVALCDEVDRLRTEVQRLADLVVDCGAEIRLCREKDGAGPYDPTLRTRIAAVVLGHVVKP